ncbi:hypothetical protein NGF19_28340 [Streptomyces sp. RY43-2]|uniref:Uncharacterized protein n=1 Tax=Streptomyces macrolidinus TaxID=2952607 RepID=A0ABT0ZM25_9ACTN|nr:hypothetical protein [Streptomyces macrolidinus]MCN9244645.1 hypothetical protein [Streptomyces macrolidinus]
MTRTAVDTPALPAEHPGLPTLALRIAHLARAVARPAVVTLDASTAAAIEGELREPARALARQVIQDCVRA